MKNTIYILLIILTFASCDRFIHNSVYYTEIDTSNSINVSIINSLKTDDIDISDIAYDVHIVKLETSENSLIGDIDQLIFSDNYTYIFDYSLGSVLIFDNNGAFIKGLDKGNGPGEIAGSVTDIMFNKFDNLLYVSHSKGVSVFSETGDFIMDYPFLSIVTDILPTTDGGFFAIVNEMQNNLGQYCSYVIDSMFNITKCIVIDTEIRPNTIISHYLHYSIDNPSELLITRPYDNRVLSYNVEDKSFSVKYLLDFGDSQLDVSSIHSPNDYVSLHKIAFDDSKFYYNGVYYETNNFIVFRFIKGGIYAYELYYNKATSKTRCGYLFDAGIPNSGIVSGVWKDSFVKVLQPHSFYNDTVFLNSVKSSVFISSADKDKILSSEPDDNPLFVFYRMKDIPTDTE